MVALEQVEQRVQQESVVVEQRRDLRLAPAADREETPVVAPEGVEQEGARGLRLPEGGVVPEHPVRLREGGHRERVPGQQHLVVQPRPHPPGARGEQPSPRPGQSRLHFVTRDAEPLRERLVVGNAPEDRPAFPVPLGAQVVGGGEQRRLRTQHCLDLRRLPDIEPALLALGIRIERREEAAFGAPHLPAHPVEGRPRRLGAAGIPGDPVRLEVRRNEQRVVVEHLLEVGNEPLAVGGIPVEPAAELIPEPAGGHPRQREPGGRERLRVPGAVPLAEMPAEQEAQLPARGELGRRAEPAVSPVVGAQQRPHPLPGGFGGEQFAGAGAASGEGRRRPQPFEQPGAALQQPGAAGAVGPGLGDAGEHPRKPRPAPAILRREVGAAEEGRPVGGHEHRERPAAGAGGRGHEGHVDLVHLRAFLAVHLHRHEPLVHLPGDGLVLEGLVRHHMAPVATGVADREEHRDLALPRLGEGLRAPALPVDRVVAVLPQVGARLPVEPVAPRPRSAPLPASGRVGGVRRRPPVGHDFPRPGAPRRRSLVRRCAPRPSAPPRCRR